MDGNGRSHGPAHQSMPNAWRRPMPCSRALSPYVMRCKAGGAGGIEVGNGVRGVGATVESNQGVNCSGTRQTAASTERLPSSSRKVDARRRHWSLPSLRPPFATPCPAHPERPCLVNCQRQQCQEHPGDQFPYSRRVLLVIEHEGVAAGQGAQGAAAVLPAAGEVAMGC